MHANDNRPLNAAAHHIAGRCDSPTPRPQAPRRAGRGPRTQAGVGARSTPSAAVLGTGLPLTLPVAAAPVTCNEDVAPPWVFPLANWRRFWMMRSTLAAAVAAMVALAAPAKAAPVSYSMTFTNTVTTGAQPATPSGSFTYDSATKTFSAFKVSIRGVDFDLTAVANEGTQGSDCSAGKSAFDILTGNTSCPANQVWYFLDGESVNGFFIFASVDPLIPNTGQMGVAVPALDAYVSLATLPGNGADDGGTFTIAPRTVPVPVPEPTSLALIGLGLAGLAATRRRATRCGG